MKSRLLATALLAMVLVGACSASESERPGNPQVYERIANTTDCAKLQEEFNLAEQTSERPGGPEGATWSEIGIAYMEAADERMREVGCYN